MSEYRTPYVARDGSESERLSGSVRIYFHNIGPQPELVDALKELLQAEIHQFVAKCVRAVSVSSVAFNVFNQTIPDARMRFTSHQSMSKVDVWVSPELQERALEPLTGRVVALFYMKYTDGDTEGFFNGYKGISAGYTPQVPVRDDAHTLSTIGGPLYQPLERYVGGLNEMSIPLGLPSTPYAWQKGSWGDGDNRTFWSTMIDIYPEDQSYYIDGELYLWPSLTEEIVAGTWLGPSQSGPGSEVGLNGVLVDLRLLARRYGPDYVLNYTMGYIWARVPSSAGAAGQVWRAQWLFNYQGQGDSPPAEGWLYTTNPSDPYWYIGWTTIVYPITQLSPIEQTFETVYAENGPAEIGVAVWNLGEEPIPYRSGSKTGGLIDHEILARNPTQITRTNHIVRWYGEQGITSYDLYDHQIEMDGHVRQPPTPRSL